MTKDEFIELRNKFKEGDEVKIRYYTYNKKDYIDVIGKVFSLYGYGYFGSGNPFMGNSQCLTMEYLGTCKYHDNFTGKNFPLLNIFYVANKMYCHVYSHQIISIKPASIRAYKIQRLKTKKG